MLVGSRLAPMWIASLIETLRVLRGVELAIAEVPESPPRASRLLRLYEKADASVFRQAPDALRLSALPEPAFARLDEASTCDVLLAFVQLDRAPTWDAQFGTWVLTQADERGQTSDPALFWPSARGEVVETRLEAVLAGGERRLLYSSFGAADGASLHRGRNRAAWKARAAILSRLDAVRSRGVEYLGSRPLVRHPPTPPAMVRSRHVAGFAARAALGVLARRIRSIAIEDPWFIGVRRRDPSAPRGAPGVGPPFVTIDSPAGRAYADPFVLDVGGRTYVFFEDFDRRSARARISHLLLDEAAKPIGRPATALEADHHLSYPFVFHREGEIFMIPESSADGTVTLYRAIDFPSEWTRERVLLEDVAAVDATLLEHDGRLWLFANVADSGASLNDDLHLFSASSLDGPWRPHPENPVVADARRARPAGRIFPRGDELIRPAQDCSASYGRSIVLNRIDVLTEREYRETPLARIDPTWTAALAATHTYTFSETVEALDGRRPRPRWRRRFAG